MFDFFLKFKNVHPPGRPRAPQVRRGTGNAAPENNQARLEEISAPLLAFVAFTLRCARPPRSSLFFFEFFGVFKSRSVFISLAQVEETFGPERAANGDGKEDMYDAMLHQVEDWASSVDIRAEVTNRAEDSAEKHV